jgi:hypothetical protein
MMMVAIWIAVRRFLPCSEAFWPQLSPLLPGQRTVTTPRLKLPNPMEAITNRVNGQCLVETLGNRECLVYLDPARQSSIRALITLCFWHVSEKASESLALIPGLIEQRKWSQVSGVLLGPLGTLVETMNQLTKLSANGSKAAALAAKTKTNMYDIFQAAEKKTGEKALIAHDKATKTWWRLSRRCEAIGFSKCT